MEADLTVRGTHQLALRLSLAISKESARAINVSRHFIRTLALRCSCMCAPMTESGIRRVGIFIFLPLLNLLPNDKINSIKHVPPTTNAADSALLRRAFRGIWIQRRCLGPIIPSGPVKHRNPKIANTATNRNVTMSASLRPRFNHMHCRECDLARHVSRY
jgi:hypothetical protein